MVSVVNEVILTKEEISEVVKRLGREISNDYKGKNLLLISILKGSVIFMTDLMREITIPCKIDFMAVSSYSGTKNSGGNVNILKDLSIDIDGFDVLIVEDILETGYTLRRVIDMLKSRNPKSIKICTLLDKPNLRKTDVQAEYVGKIIPEKFVIGYGFDYNEDYRQLPFIGVMNPKYM